MEMTACEGAASREDVRNVKETLPTDIVGDGQPCNNCPRQILDYILTRNKWSAAKPLLPRCRALCLGCGSESLPGGGGRLVWPLCDIRPLGLRPPLVNQARFHVSLSLPKGQASNHCLSLCLRHKTTFAFLINPGTLLTGGNQQCCGVSVGSRGKYTGFTVTKRTYITMVLTPWSCFTAHTANFHPTLRCEQCKPPTVLTGGPFLCLSLQKNMYL